MRIWAILLGGLLLVTSAKADNGAVSAELTWLDKSLTVARDEKAGGRLSADAYQSFEVKFREQLIAAKAAMDPTNENITLHARILARLGERGQAVQSLSQVLASQPSNSDVRLALGQVQLEAGDYSAALAEANAVLERDPDNKAALILKHSSAGRAAPGASGGPAAVTGPPTSKKSVVTVAPVKRAAPLPVAPPDPVSDPVSPDSTPLLPLAGAAGLGALAFSVYKSKGTVESTEGFDDEHRPPYGRGQEFVAGAVLAGLAGATIYLAGSALLSAAPAVTRYVSGVGNQGMRLAQSEAGAINPSRERTTEIVKDEIVRKGEILNRAWDSNWNPASATLSGPEGLSYCRGSCLPIHAASAIERRGLAGIVNNNAQRGALYRATEDIVVTVRKSIGGTDQEILLKSRSDISKLELVNDTMSSIPPGR